MVKPALKWHWEWKSLLFVAAFLPLLVGLGFWQLERAEEKRRVIEAVTAERSQPPVPLDQIRAPRDWQSVLVQGEFDPLRWWLLDNRIRDGRFGYGVVGLLVLADGSLLLVDRGWIAGDPARRFLPEVPTPTGPVELIGEIDLDFEAGYSLGQESTMEWPKVRQWLSPEVIAADLGEQPVPWLLRLSADSDAALAVERQAVNMAPEKHVGYAVQWYALAVALVILAVMRNSNFFSRLRRASATTRDSET